MKKVRKAVFPIAGMGTRFLPATKAVPKEMLPLVDKPMIQYVVEEAIESGIEEIILVTARGKTSIEDHFDHAVELEQLLKEKGKEAELKLVNDITYMSEFAYVRQRKPLGLGHAVLTARELVKDEPFAVLLGDDIIYSQAKPALRQLIEVYEKTGHSVIALEEVPEEDVSKYGVITPEDVEGNTCRITDLVEKPPRDKAPSNLAVIGRYVLTPDIWEILENLGFGAGGEIQLTDGLNILADREPVYGCRFDGIRYDAGNKLGFLTATVEYALRREDLGVDFKEYLKNLSLD